MLKNIIRALALAFVLVTPAVAQNVCGSQGACVQQSPTRPDAAIAVNSATAAVNTATTNTVTVPGGLYAYISAIYIDVCGDATGTAVTNGNISSSGISGTPSWSYSSTIANSISTCLRLGDSFATPLKSSAPGTNVVITSPVSLHTAYTIRVYYYLAP